MDASSERFYRRQLRIKDDQIAFLQSQLYDATHIEHSDDCDCGEEGAPITSTDSTEPKLVPSVGIPCEVVAPLAIDGLCREILEGK